MTGVVEELAEALQALLDFRGGVDVANREQARRVLARFNAERERGVWVPREPTEAMIQSLVATLRKPAFGPRGDALAIYRAMIAAINPESGHDPS